MKHRAEVGRRGEDVVEALLRERGYAIVGRNVRVGRLELDLLARRGGLLIVCEVRSRTSDRVVAPVETIGREKIQRVRRATARWLMENAWPGATVRFDAASVVFDGPRGAPRVDYYEDAF